MLQTPLIDFHKAHNARLVDFAGWEMPIQYTGIREEHHHTRTAASLFDVSHMGRLYLSGKGTDRFLDHVCTRRIDNMTAGQSRYSHVCKEDGGILDDVIVSKLADDQFLVVCNASNRTKIVNWFNRYRGDFQVELDDRTRETAMAAVQGPKALELVNTILPIELGDLKRYHFKAGSLFGASYFIARSGYTGEDGLEVILPAKFVKMALQPLIEKSESLGTPIKPAGLGARDTLRLEAGMPLYGHELTEDWDPITAGQKWCCYLEKDFVGGDAIKQIAEQGPARRLVGLEIDGRRIARDGAKVLADNQEVGFVTSGTHSPTFDKAIAMAFVDAARTAVGTALAVDVRGKPSPAKVVKLPFYRAGS